MQPLTELSGPNLRQLRGVVFDVDDTLTRNGRLEQVAFEALLRLAEAKLILIAVTGRPLGWTDVFASQWPVAIAVGENGAGWSWVRRGVLGEGYLFGAEARQKQRNQLQRIQAQVQRMMPSMRLTRDCRVRRCDLAFDTGETTHVSPELVDQLVGIIEDEGGSAVVSSIQCHASGARWDKAKGVTEAVREVLDEDLNATKEQWLFVGDSGKDAAAFQFFPAAVGVRHVKDPLERIPPLPADITQADRGAGFAEVADHILRALACPTAGSLP
ncbi:MAG: HAD hydrolase family protein [Myxococcota bacterium]